MTAGSMLPYFKVTFDKKKANASVRDEIMTPLIKGWFGLSNDDDVNVDNLPKDGHGWTANEDKFQREWLKGDNDRFRPMGDKVFEYRLNSNDDDDLKQQGHGREGDDVFEVYRCTFEGTERFKEYHRRLQPLLLFFIEGASFIDEEDPKWETYLLFRKSNSSGFQFVGFVTCYDYFSYPQSIRKRISQFLILPPFQGKGHGGRIYRFLYRRFLADSKVVDVTVEDPTEEFSDMRCKNDLRMLMEAKAFEGQSVPYSPAFLKHLQEQYKLSKQHVTQLAEMFGLRSVRGLGDVQMKKYRVWVKKRLFKRNEEALDGIEADVVKDKLEETFRNVTADYCRIIESI
jgi:histone acetyltransferase 1